MQKYIYYIFLIIIILIYPIFPAGIMFESTVNP